MALDAKLLGDKLKRYREQFQLSLEEVENATGIKSDLLILYEDGKKQPTGDEILIFADFYRCDYKFFVSNEKLAPFEQTETLFRRFGEHLSKSDRWAIQEFLFLAECEAFLQSELQIQPLLEFSFSTSGSSYKAQATNAAKALRKSLGYSDSEVRLDIYSDFRKIGIHIFRRQLTNSNISGLFVRHPVAGKCVLVNYNEDMYRQRFTAAHEVGHSILDDNEDFVVSLRSDKHEREKRANTFASRYLMPPEFLVSIPKSEWNVEDALKWASKFKVSTEALAYALRQAGLIHERRVVEIKAVRVPKDQKIDPELSEDLSPNSRLRKETLLGRGLSDYYVKLCFSGYRMNVISASRLAEMLLVNSESKLRELADLYNEILQYDH